MATLRILANISSSPFSIGEHRTNREREGQGFNYAFSHWLEAYSYSPTIVWLWWEDVVLYPVPRCNLFSITAGSKTFLLYYSKHQCTITVATLVSTSRPPTPLYSYPRTTETYDRFRILTAWTRIVPFGVR